MYAPNSQSPSTHSVRTDELVGEAETSCSSFTAAISSWDPQKPDICAFARFLQHRRCLEWLLFWKETEQYNALFTGGERRRMAEKIFAQFCEPGAYWELGLSEQTITAIKAVIVDGELDELFNEAQQEAYLMMLLDLFPTFISALQQVDGGGCEGFRENDEHPASSLSVVLSGTDPAAGRSFHRFAKEHFCEENLFFWIEAKKFDLLFRKVDLDCHARFIYDTYMGPTARCRANVSDMSCACVRRALDQGEVHADLFRATMREVEQFIEFDVFPRYESWLAESASAGAESQQAAASSSAASSSAASARAVSAAASTAASASATTATSTAAPPKKRRPLRRSSVFLYGSAAQPASEESLQKARPDIGDAEATRRFLATVIASPREYATLRAIATERDCCESLDFYQDVQDYRLLFRSEDLCETAERIWNAYLDDKSEKVITLPDGARKKIRRILDGPPEKVTNSLLDKAEQETLRLLADNLISLYLERSQQAQAEADGPTKAAPSKSASSGCIVM